MTGIEVKEWREERELTQVQLAELLPVSLRTLQGWETGKGQPALYIVRALADLDRGLDEVTVARVSVTSSDWSWRGEPHKSVPPIKKDDIISLGGGDAHLDAVAAPAMSKSVIKRHVAQRGIRDKGDSKR